MKDNTPFIAVPEDLTRREFMFSALGAALLVACGDDDGETPAEGASRSIEHMYGTTEIRGIPQRVVSVGWTEQDALLALGVVPVGTTEWFGDHPGAIHPWAQDELGDADIPEVLQDSDGIEFERIAALRPDLILALYVPFGLTKEDYDRLSQIAPTVAPPAGSAEGGISWQELTRTVGVAVGQPEEAGGIVSEVEALFEAAKKAHPEFIGATAINAYPTEEGGYQVYPPPDPGGRLLTDLGFKVPEEIVELADGAAWVDLSGEQLHLLDTGVLVWLVDSYAQRDQLKAQPLYAGLNVAKQGRDVFLSYEEDGDIAAATSIQTVLSLPFLLDQLVPKLAAAIDGDPATVVK